MRIFLTGVACVGKTTIGVKLAGLLDYRFFDLDHEIEDFFGTSIERLQNRHLTLYSFRAEASRALTHLLAREGSADLIVALPPSGLMGGYWKVVKNMAASAIVAIKISAGERRYLRISRSIMARIRCMKSFLRYSEIPRRINSIVHT
jgi:shikimate kinase